MTRRGFEFLRGRTPDHAAERGWRLNDYAVLSSTKIDEHLPAATVDCLQLAENLVEAAVKNTIAAFG